MPELPEVETTIRGLRKKLIGLKILSVWTDLSTKDKRKNDTIANPKYFTVFKKEISNKKIISIKREAKNILINLSENKTILIHLKLTGYLFYGKNPNVRFAHVVFTLSNKNHLVFSDMRKFGKITLLNTKTAYASKHLKNIGPDPLSKSFNLNKLKECLLKKPNGKIKTVLMDQGTIAGIGNIYSDEILWHANIKPERKISQIKETEFKKLLKAVKKTLLKGINFGGDSVSDYLNIDGLPGKFQLHHEAYRRTGKKCRKKGCRGVIIRKIINNRSAHFCSAHQI
ncbi:DNA-formamidopyrimidine glycosylase [Patescibacteria group bacterium]|nr:DNA-formamidopyrimidine glycosylase [Patescibacteria group bacterium]MBU1727880.1 DNA-formamidopyrimidine glycosylase [Patescibacteria group bacterium]